MRCASTVMQSPKPPIKKCAANYGRIYCPTWLGIRSATAPSAQNLAPSNVGLNPIRCSIDRVESSWKSPTAVAIGKAAPAIIDALTKGHSRQSSLFTQVGGSWLALQQVENTKASRRA